MKETDRQARNAQRLAECEPSFGQLVSGVLRGLEARGLRPRIQEAWRPPGNQLAAFKAGRSKLKFGFHNLTASDGRPAALAVDILDDDAPLGPGARYLLMLAAEARARGLETGILWGLPVALRKGVDEAIALQRWDAPVKVGWDPCHVQIVGTMPEEAAAKRAKSH